MRQGKKSQYDCCRERGTAYWLVGEIQVDLVNDPWASGQLKGIESERKLHSKEAWGDGHDRGRRKKVHREKLPTPTFLHFFPGLALFKRQNEWETVCSLYPRRLPTCQQI